MFMQILPYLSGPRTRSWGGLLVVQCDVDTSCTSSTADLNQTPWKCVLREIDCLGVDKLPQNQWQITPCDWCSWINGMSDGFPSFLSKVDLCT